MEFVRCTEVVRLSESPLIEVSLYTTSRGYFESLTTGVVWRTPQKTTSKEVYLSASAPAPMRMVLVT